MLQFYTIYTGVDVSIVKFVYSLSMAWIYGDGYHVFIRPMGELLRGTFPRVV